MAKFIEKFIGKRSGVLGWGSQARKFSSVLNRILYVQSNILRELPQGPIEHEKWLESTIRYPHKIILNIFSPHYENLRNFPKWWSIFFKSNEFMKKKKFRQSLSQSSLESRAYVFHNFDKFLEAKKNSDDDVTTFGFSLSRGIPCQSADEFSN